MRMIFCFSMIWLFMIVAVSGQEVRLHKEKFNRKNIKSEFYTLKKDRKIQHGAYNSYWYGGIQKEQGQFHNNLKDGEWIIYNNRGNVSEIQTFDKGKKTGIWQKYYESGQVIKRYDHSQGIELEPYIRIATYYPSIARENKIEGTVKVEYELDDQCNLKYIGIAKSLSMECDQSALEGVKKVIVLLKKYSSSSCDTLYNIVDIEFKLH